MSTILTQRTVIKLILALTAILAVLIPFLPFRPALVALFAVLYFFAIIFFLNLKLGLLLLILIRPCFDILTGDYLFSLGSLSFNFSSLLAIITLAAAGLAILGNPAKFGRMPLKPAFLLFLGLAAISAYFTFDRTASLVEWLRLVSIFAVFALSGVLADSARDLERLMLAIIFSTVVPGVFAFYQFFTQTGVSVPLEGIYNRIYGTFSHPNLFAYYLVLPLGLALYLFFSGDKKKISRLLAIILLPALIVLLVLTFTRGAWLAFIVIALVLGAVKFKKLFFGVVVVAVLAYLLIPPIQQRVSDLTSNPNNSISWRLALWRDAVTYAAEKPLLGYGTGTAKELILEKRGEQFGSSDPHNDYLKIALENGLLGLSAYLFLIGNLFAVLAGRYLKNRGRSEALLLTVIAVTISFYGLSLVDNILRNTALQWSYWALLGAVLAASDATEKFKSSPIST